MKLRNRMTLGVILLLMATVLLTGFTILHIFTSSFRNYLLEDRARRIVQITADIGSIIREENHILNNQELARYAKNERIDIRLLDPDDRTLAVYDGFDEAAAKSVEQQGYVLINAQQEVLGTLQLSYDPADSSLDVAVTAFLTEARGALLLSLLAIALVGGLAAFFYSKKITTPIIRLSEQTKRLRNKEYELELPVSDITEIRDLSNNLRVLSHTLATQEAIRHDYAQDISHELRTPLTNLQLHLEAIQDGIIEADQQSMDVLLNDAHRLNELVERLKNTFQDTSLLAQITIENMDLSLELERLLTGFEPSLQAKQAHLIRAIEPHINLALDRQLFGHILANLLSNAVKAIEPGGTIRVALTRLPQQVVLSVRDDGVGIAPEDQSRIFDRFYRVDSARNSQNGGQGLGLSITKNLVTALNGQISLTSELGKGTEFTVVFLSQRAMTAAPQ
ncbi:MAG: HAMP domain-containing sensor histidine kinase [Ndongobacter sp.]|nr:HAMP domain-containing sensor histidine kinase [Ndongobacter sp.]